LIAPQEPARDAATDGAPASLLASRAHRRHLIQPSTGNDYTELMQRFAATYLASQGGVDGFLLKSRSPSCGLYDVKLYGNATSDAPTSLGAGLFAAEALARFPHLAIEDEARLANPLLREHFLTKLFALARFRQVHTAEELVRYQSVNKLLLMAYHQREQKVLGRIVANPEHRPIAEVIADYRAHLGAALARPPQEGAHINTLMHAGGYFSDALGSAEKAFFLDALEKYRAGVQPLAVSTNLVRSWIARFGEPYLAEQSYFQPYPEALLDLNLVSGGCDVDKPLRDYWKTEEEPSLGHSTGD
jgi:uncharacterized protein YbgA (DUF1722 family)